MKPFKLFYLEKCPYCKKVFKYLEDIKKQYPQYSQIALELIEESQQSELANQYDYYYVPAFYYQKQKLFEGAMTKEDVLGVLKSVFEK